MTSMEENMGNTQDDSRERFARYLKENEGKEINSRVVEAGKREMDLGARGGFAVYGDEPTREEKFKRDPEGQLFKTDLSPAQLEDKLKSLIHARSALVDFLEHGVPEGFEITKETTLRDLINELKGGGEGIAQAIEELIQNGYGPTETLYELPGILEDEIERNQIMLDHKK